MQQPSFSGLLKHGEWRPLSFARLSPCRTDDLRKLLDALGLALHHTVVKELALNVSVRLPAAWLIAVGAARRLTLAHSCACSLASQQVRC